MKRFKSFRIVLLSLVLAASLSSYIYISIQNQHLRSSTRSHLLQEQQIEDVTPQLPSADLMIRVLKSGQAFFERPY